MTIMYPLNLPTSRQAAQISIRPNNVVGESRSPFSGIRQTVVYPGQWWEADIALPPLRDPEAQDWITFLLKLRGKSGTFLMGDPARRLPFGSAAATPGTPVVDGGDQTGNDLNLKGLPTSTNGYLLKGDYIQLNQKLFKVLDDVDTDSDGKATVTVWPMIQQAYEDEAAVFVTDCVGLFALTENNSGWAAEPGTVYHVSFTAREVV